MTEDEVRRLLNARTATIDPPPVPLPEISRLGRQRRGRQRAFRVAGAAALVAAVALGGIGLRSVVSRGNTSPTSSQQTDGLAGVPPTATQLYGDWRAVELFGKDVARVSGPVSKSLVVSFSKTHVATDMPSGISVLGWSGSDLCNAAGGTAVLRGNGTFHTKTANLTQVGCGLVGAPGYRFHHQAVRAVLAARQARLDGGQLVLLSAGGQELARFSRIGPAPVPNAKAHAQAPGQRQPIKTTMSAIAPPTK